MRILFHALMISAAINTLTVTCAFAQREGGREPAGINREPAGGRSGKEGGGGERGGPEKDSKGGAKGKSGGNEKGGEKTTISHENGEKTVVTSDKNGSNIERHGTTERTRESHKEAVDRVEREAKERGEKAVVEKKVQSLEKRVKWN